MFFGDPAKQLRYPVPDGSDRMVQPENGVAQKFKGYNL
jgi:hypothetical protein